MIRNRKLFNEYFVAIESGSHEGKSFLVKNKSALIRGCGRSLFQEMILNYRTLKTPYQKTKIIKQFTRLIVDRKKHYTSDIAIACNIVANVNLSVTEEKIFIDFLFSRVRKYFSQDLQRVLDSSQHSIKKTLIINKANQVVKLRYKHKFLFQMFLQNIFVKFKKAIQL